MLFVEIPVLHVLVYLQTLCHLDLNQERTTSSGVRNKACLEYQISTTIYFVLFLITLAFRPHHYFANIFLSRRCVDVFALLSSIPKCSSAFWYVLYAHNLTEKFVKTLKSNHNLNNHVHSLATWGWLQSCCWHCWVHAVLQISLGGLYWWGKFYFPKKISKWDFKWMQ